MSANLSSFSYIISFPRKCVFDYRSLDIVNANDRISFAVFFTLKFLSLSHSLLQVIQNALI